MPCTTCGGHADAGGKKTAETIRQQVEGEVNALLRLVFEEQRNTGRLDLEAVEIAPGGTIVAAAAQTSNGRNMSTAGASGQSIRSVDRAP